MPTVSSVEFCVGCGVLLAFFSPDLPSVVSMTILLIGFNNFCVCTDVVYLCVFSVFQASLSHLCVCVCFSL